VAPKCDRNWIHGSIPICLLQNKRLASIERGILEFARLFERRLVVRQLRLLFAVFALSTAVFAAESPFSGTWKLNLAKSKLPPPAPQSDIAKVDANDNGLKFSEDITDDKGQLIKISYEAKFDGKDYPVTGDPTSDSILYRRVNANTLTGTTKKGGKIAGKFKLVVSKDGKVTTVNFTDYSQGRPMTGVGVYDKQ
jgi:hypothetical protein